MDSKRPYQYRALRRIATLLLVALTLASCTWVKDDTEECRYGFWLQLHYTYNILDVEAAPEYINDAFVYVYDADGNYVRRIDVTRAQLTANNHRVRVEGLDEGDYQFVVWSGIGNSPYAVTEDTKTISDFRVQLAATGSTASTQLPDLYFGALPTVHYDSRYAVYDVSMMKDTNQLSCLAVSLADDSLTPDNCSLTMTASNSAMDARNRLSSPLTVEYTPFQQKAVTIDDPDYGELHGVQFSIKTLRLMADSDCRLLLHKKGQDEPVLNISLPEYIALIGSLYTNLGREVGLQEYLDRQDFYTVVLLFSEGLDQLLQLRVNSWRVRAYNHLKL